MTIDWPGPLVDQEIVIDLKIVVDWVHNHGQQIKYIIMIQIMINLSLADLKDLFISDVHHALTPIIL